MNEDRTSLMTSPIPILEILYTRILSLIYAISGVVRLGARKKSKARTESLSPFTKKIKAMTRVRQLQAHELTIRMVLHQLTHTLYFN